MTRVCVAGTVDAAVSVDFDLAVKEFQRKAKKENATIPTQSDILQEVIKKGLVQVRKQERPTANKG